MTFDCMACGRTLEVPDGLPEGAEFGCPACRLVLRNVEAARAFRWARQPAFQRRHGASRFNYWGGLIGAVAWIPVALAILAFVGRLEPAPVVAGGLYVGAVVWAMRRRAGMPAMLFTTLLWLIMGGFGALVAAVLAVRPELIGVPPPVPWESVLPLAVLSGFFLVAGVVARITYLRRYAQVPKAAVVGEPGGAGA